MTWLPVGGWVSALETSTATGSKTFPLCVPSPVVRFVLGTKGVTMTKKHDKKKAERSQRRPYQPPSVVAERALVQDALASI